ncbi:sugar-binding transcriptional regulator [Burkholderia aenigmatica]|uniref:DNA-binding transcriptional regulator n=1 Tax=Burkholderia aenigmatica TaxID=2015348 RepID=A0A228INL0_9BURK|nr:sugar-binding domain-containing protein [Burkholderia aenigmatica]OXI43845.1 DNA-binding transcriptional regulator [Burkholderia aenigmatica]
MLDLNLAHESDDSLIARVAWMYYVGGLNQEQTASRLGLHRTRVNRLLSEARDRGLVSITINHDAARDFEIEHAIAQQFGLDFCIATPALGFGDAPNDEKAVLVRGAISRRAVGAAGASFLKGKISSGPITIGVSWGRTIEQVAHQLSGVRNSEAKFVSLLGSLKRNSTSNPFEVVQFFAAQTGGEVHFLPVPFIANSIADKQVFLAQRIVQDAMELARAADLYLISVGELKDTSVLRTQEILTSDELASIRESGAVADSIGKLFDMHGCEIEHPLSQRTLAIDTADLRSRNVVLLAGGVEKTRATLALLRSGIVKGLIIDGDTAIQLRDTMGAR